MSKADIANKIERQLSLHDQVVLSVAEWNMVIEALREPLRAVSSDETRQYIVPASASHGPR